MDLFSKIREEHVILLGLVDDLVGADPITHRKTMDELTLRILAHMNAEEQSIYRAFEELDAIPRSVALRHEQEHHVAKMMMTELQDRIVDNEIWTAKLQVFQFVVKHHVESEEKTLFDIAQDYFNDEEISKIAQEFDRVEADLYKRSTIEPLTRS
jgi:hemerythrin-like domain-containing protein